LPDQPGNWTALRLQQSSSATASLAAAPGFVADESYIYGSGGWGRVNFGEEDGAAYLLQVAAPSADSNVDGMRVYVQAIDSSSGNWNNTGNNLQAVVFDYQQADFRQTDRLTYLTPKFNGFQAGVSWAPYPGASVIGGSVSNPQFTNVPNYFKNPWEAAARWDGEFQGVAIALGGGYSDAQTENSAGSAV